MVAGRITRRLLQTFAHQLPHRTSAEDDERVGRLTAREREVLAHVAQGRSNAEIATAPHLAGTTVKTRLSRILMKPELRDRAQAIVFACETHLVQPP